MHTIVKDIIGKQNKNKLFNGFTLVELLVVIAVIGILATISVVGYGNWQKSIIETQLKSDLANAATAMNSYRNFNDTYPSTIPTTFKSSQGTILTGGSSNGTIYCIEASSLQNTTLHYHITQESGSNGAEEGICPIFTLTTIAGTGGTVNAGGTYNSGTTQTITATPNTNYTFSSWTGSAGCSGAASHTITIDSNKSCTANFAASGSPYIQTITTASCPTTRTQVQDARDNHTYWIQKLADGKCWMLTNLGYAGGGTNTYGDAKTLANGTSGSTTYTVASYYVIPSTTNFTTEPTAPSTSTDGTGQYGYLYNFCGANGGQTGNGACSSSTGSTAVNTTISICPAGWRLPTSNGGEFTALNTAINSGSTTTDAGLIGTPWLAQRGGGWYGGFNNQGSSGRYWSSTQDPDTNAYGLYFYGTYRTGVDPASSSSKEYGIAVRCVGN